MNNKVNLSAFYAIYSLLLCLPKEIRHKGTLPTVFCLDYFCCFWFLLFEVKGFVFFYLSAKINKISDFSKYI